MSKRGKTEIRSFKVEELLDWARNGRLRVPDFQRKLRWEGRNVVELFDSIYNAFPIGTLLLARRPMEPATVRFGSVQFPPTPGADTHWIIDGQQRLTSIVGTLLHPDAEPKHDQFAVYFDLEQEKFFIRRKREVAPTAIPLRELGESTTVLSWLRRWPLASERPELEPRVFELSKAIREFTVAAAIVEGDDTLLRSIFVRTNRAGRAMKEAEVFEALYGLTPAQSLAAAAARISSEAGEIEPNTLLRCAKHVAGMDPGERPEDLPEVDAQFVERAATALKRVLGFLSDDCELPHLELVQQRFILMPLSRFFSLFPKPTPRARRLLRRWVWRGLASGGFDQTGFGPIRTYQRTIVGSSKDEVVAAEMLKLVGTDIRPVELPANWNSTSMETKFLAALLIRNLSDDDTETFLESLNSGQQGLAEAGVFIGARQVPEAWVPLANEELHTEALGFSAEVRQLLANGNIEQALACRRTVLARMTADFVTERCELGASDRVSIRQLVGAA